MKQLCKRGIGLILTLLLCAGALPALSISAAADTREEMQQAIVQTAIAYYLNGVDQQYDSTPLSEGYDRDAGGNLRHWHYYAPEEATPDQTAYSVCSEYCFEVVYNALGYKLMNDPRHSVTKYMQSESKGPVVAFQFDNRKVSEAEADAAAERGWQTLQPGDVAVYCGMKSKTNAGHAMMFVGDIDGDGKPEILHSGGKKYDMETGLDRREKKGTVHKNSAEAYYHTKGKSNYFGSKGMYTILRVIDDPDQPCAITPWARTRMKYPWMRCVRTVSTGCYGAVEQGGELTYTTVIYNKGKQDFKDVPMTDVVPEGTELIRASEGVTQNGGNLAWTFDIPAGESKQISMNVRVTAPLGTEIVSDGGKVGQIPMKVLTTVVCGDRKALEEVHDYPSINKKLAGANPGRGTEQANAIYRYGMGVEIGIPDADVLFSTLCVNANVPDHNFYTLRDDYRSTALGKMVVRHWIGGRFYHAKDTKERVVETRLKDLQCGDLIIVAEKLPMKNKDTKVYFCNGTHLLGFRSGLLDREDEIEVEKLLSKPFFVALRPVQAYENIKARASATARFSDVKNTDWFNGYVSELAADGVIGGMTATSFAPNGTLTYGQALKLITLGVGEKEPAKSGKHWASGYLTLARSKGWLTEDVNLDATITRAAFCRIAAKAKNVGAGTGFNPFIDTDDPAVLSLYRAGVVSGVTQTQFKPDAPLTRAQIAKIIWTLRKI